MENTWLLGLLFSITFIPFIFSLKSSGNKSAICFCFATIGLVISIFTLERRLDSEVDPEVERQALPPHTIALSELDPGVYEYVDVWEITPFYLVPMRKMGEGSKKWTFVIFSKDDKVCGKVPPGRTEKENPFRHFGHLEIKDTSTNRFFRVIDAP